MIRDAARDIAALASSGYVTAGGALPIGERVQTSGRGEPDLVRLSSGAREALALLTHWYAQGGKRRRQALALWLTYAYAEPASALELACVLTLSEGQRLERAREWQRWGRGSGAQRLTSVGVSLLGSAIGLYETAAAEVGYAGRLGELQRAADAARGSWGRMRDEHERELLRAKVAKASSNPANQQTRAQRRAAKKGKAA